MRAKTVLKRTDLTGHTPLKIGPAAKPDRRLIPYLEKRGTTLGRVAAKNREGKKDPSLSKKKKATLPGPGGVERKKLFWNILFLLIKKKKHRDIIKDHNCSTATIP